MCAEAYLSFLFCFIGMSTHSETSSFSSYITFMFIVVLTVLLVAGG